MQTRFFDSFSRSSLRYGCAAAAIILACLPSVASATLYSTAVLADNPLAYWRFDDANANNNSTAANLGSSGGSGTGTYIGGNMSLVANTFNGGTNELGTAVNVGAAGNRVNVPHSGALDMQGTQTASFEVWVNYASPSNYGRIWDNNWQQSHFMNQSGASGQWIIGAVGGPLVTSALQGTGWRYIVATYDNNAGDGERWKLYLDGTKVSTSNTSTNFGAGVSTMTLFTHFGGGDGYVGLADEIAFYNTTLSPERITAHFNAAQGIGVPEPSTFALAGLGLTGLAGWGLRRRMR